MNANSSTMTLHQIRPMIAIEGHGSDTELGDTQRSIIGDIEISSSRVDEVSVCAAIM